MSRPISIVGGGLAGLSLGIGLRKRGISATILEAGSYPRHRVCGEFICGVSPATLENLGIGGAFDIKVTNRDSAWFYRDRQILKRRLPAPAIGISRYHLDRWLADEFARLGGDLRTGTRAQPDQLPAEATAWCSGRQRSHGGDLLGLKGHARGLAMDTDLQMHFGRDCYVGLSRVEGGKTNVCGLFRQRRELGSTDRTRLLLNYLEAAGLDRLARSLASAELDSESMLGVSAFQLGKQVGEADAAPGQLRLGDSYAMIPPFTGNGMTMAFQSAEIALQPLLDYHADRSTWQAAVDAIRSEHQRRFARRLRWAMRLHPFMRHPVGQRSLAELARIHAIPFGLFFEKTR